MRAAGALIAIALALALQTTLARFVVGGSTPIDLVLVAVVYVALTSGAASGMLAGSVAGLIQDALSSGIIGIGGLAKSIVGFVVGAIGQQFIVTAAHAPAVVFMARHGAARGAVHGAVRGARAADVLVAVGGRGDARRSATPWSDGGVCDHRGAAGRDRTPAHVAAASDEATAEAEGQRPGYRIAMAVAEDRRRIAIRLIVLQGGAVGVFAALAISFWFLQVVQHAKYEEMAENNHQRTLALRAPRGVLFDRNGTVLVENRHSFTISIVREHTEGPDAHDPRCCRRWRTSTRSEVQRDRRSAPRASRATGRSSSSRTRRWRRSPPSRRAGSTELPDVVVEQVPTRHYPTEAMAAHLFGYVGEASDAQLGGGRRRRARSSASRASRRSTTSC